MPRPLEQAVVVITGASSGIGRAAALRIARRGGAVALCARSEAPLAAVAAECEAAGAEVLHRSLDVSEEQAVEDFAAAAEARFGRIDVWVNNAATMTYGTFVDGTWGQVPAEGNVLRGTEPHRVDGGWRRKRRAALRRAFFAAAGGGISGILRRNA